MEKKLQFEDAAALTGFVSELNKLQAQYGQHRLAFEELLAQQEAERSSIKTQVNQKYQELQAFSQELMKKYAISLDQGTWTLDTVRGVFIGPTISSTKKKSPKARRK